MASDLDALDAQVHRDLQLIAHPTLDWMPERTTATGERMLDVLIVGAGQGGLALAFRLRSERVHNIRVVDAAARGTEGVWRTYARMPTLRSPKHYTGPDLGVPSLTYRAWHEARFGAEDWDRMALIPTGHWADYLDWFREVLALPVSNRQRLVDIELADDHVVAHLETPDGRVRVPTRKLVLATGQDGTGRWLIPDALAGLSTRQVAHCADDIDFRGLAGRQVVVVGAGASAADAAIAALDNGAASVRMLCRRTRLQVVQPYRWLTFAGFLRHYSDLDDLARWRFMAHILGLREGIPPDTHRRLRSFDGFALHTGTEVLEAQADGDALRLRTRTPGGDQTLHADFVICGTGIEVDFHARPELRRIADAVRTWGDAFTPPPGEEDPRLLRYPYLGPDQEFTARELAEAPALSRIHDFTFGATMSFGASGCSINAMKIAVPKLASAITRGLFREDLPLHFRSLADYDVAMYEPE
jgi:cation diffusion facilitator CzcD-associated flavoprotein CzcO